MRFKITSPETKQDYIDYYSLRWRLLRKPWDEPEGTEQDEIENQCFHIMVKDENNFCIGVGRLQFNTATQAQIRYMAVSQTHERKGIGKSIVAILEKKAKEKNITTIVLDAREPAVGFYKKLGYELKEKNYLLFNSIQHYKMEKNIT